MSAEILSRQRQDANGHNAIRAWDDDGINSLTCDLLRDFCVELDTVNTCTCSGG